MGNALETYNQALFLKINALPGTPEWLIDFGIFCAQYLIFLLPLILLIYWFAGGREERGTALFAAATAFTGLSLGFLCSAVWFHPRPFMIRLGHLWIDHVADSSFPSDHGTLFLSITLALFARRSWLGGIALALMSALVAWARIFLGVHFPLDMVGSLAMAVIALLMTQRMWLHKGALLLSLFEALFLLLLSFLPFKFVRWSNRR